MSLFNLQARHTMRRHLKGVKTAYLTSNFEDGAEQVIEPVSDRLLKTDFTKGQPDQMLNHFQRFRYKEFARIFGNNQVRPSTFDRMLGERRTIRTDHRLNREVMRQINDIDDEIFLRLNLEGQI